MVGDGGRPHEPPAPPGEVAGALADSFTVAGYARRGRGDSGDTLPYSSEREIEDLAP